MGAANYQHEIKTLFLVVNSCLTLTIGLLPLSFGVTIALSADGGRRAPPELILGSIAVGTFIVCLASLGYYAAIVNKRAALRVYATVMGLVTAAEVIAVAKFTDPTGEIVFLTFHTAVTLAATTLASVLAKQARRIYPVLPVPAANPTAPTAL